MNRTKMVTIGIPTLWLVVMSLAISAQDKYSVTVPGGLALAEFRGYETWQVVSVSHSDKTLNVIVANPLMIAAYAAGVPGNGQPFPDGAKSAKIQYIPKKSTDAPFDVSIPDKQLDVAFMAKDSSRFASSGGWGYGLFNYDAKTKAFTPGGQGTSCGFACHMELTRSRGRFGYATCDTVRRSYSAGLIWPSVE
jgi:hypothetical protein